MPRAAPGAIARGALRWILTGEPTISGQKFGRYDYGYSSRKWCMYCIEPGLRKYENADYFTLHSSIIVVVSGRLGEVVSMEGDCRPPPPGNPRLLSTWSSDELSSGELLKDPFSKVGLSGFNFNLQKNGGEFLTLYKHLSLKIHRYPSNLKKFIRTEYFKNICSYFSCAVKCTVLEFVNSHCHLYGFRVVGLPSIAITNVLLT
jgi:hypothetical protein